MATYNKRGYKPKKEKIDKAHHAQHAIEDESTTAEVFNTLDETASKTEAFVQKNQRYIFGIIGIVVITILGYLGYQEFFLKPKKIIAMDNLHQAQSYFEEAVNGTQSDSLYQLALHGDGKNLGFLSILKEHSNTPSANLANYYAGTAYLHLKDYKNAITYLSEFKSDDEILAPLAKGNIGDAFAQLNQKEDALDYYLQAAEMRSNTYTTPRYLLKAGMIALELGKSSQAKTYFERIKNTYPGSPEAINIDTFIGQAIALSNQ